MAGGAGAASDWTGITVVAVRRLVRPRQVNWSVLPTGAFEGTTSTKTALPTVRLVKMLTTACGAVEPMMSTVQSSISFAAKPESVTTTWSPGSAATGKIEMVGTVWARARPTRNGMT